MSLLGTAIGYHCDNEVRQFTECGEPYKPGSLAVEQSSESVAWHSELYQS